MYSKPITAVILLTIVSLSPAFGEPGDTGLHGASAHWVIFRDKGVQGATEHERAVNALISSYHPRALLRRQLRRTDPGLFDERDFPIVPAYVDAVRATGATIRVQSPWVNAVSVNATNLQLARIRALPFVRETRPVLRVQRVEPISPRPALPPVGDDFYGLASEQLQQISVPELHAAGYTAKDVVIGVLDTGFLRTHNVFNDPSHPLVVIAEHDFVMGDGNTAPEPGDPPDQHAHGTMILATLAGYRPNEYVGGAYDAKFILCKTEDISSETEVEEDYYVAGLQFIEANGGDVATSSLLYIFPYMNGVFNGQTAVCTLGVNVATANGVYCCTAAGNEGHDDDPNTAHIGAPADAFEVIACGAVTSEGSIAGFSSDGPTTDGRVKPELLARGADTFTISPWNNSDYETASGTSLSTPLVASAVACLVQARPTWTVAQMRTMLFATASDQVKNGKPDPLFIRGYGILSAKDAFELDCNANGVPDPNDIASGFSKDVNLNGKPDECECVGDISGDGKVCQEDLGAVLSSFGLCTGQPGFNPSANVVKIGASASCVDQADLGVLLSQYSCEGKCP